MTKTPKISKLEQEALCDAIKIEVEMYQRGEISHLTTNRELGKLFGVSKQTISNYIIRLRKTNPDLCRYRYFEIIKLTNGGTSFEVVKEEILISDKKSTNLRKDTPKIDISEITTNSLIRHPSLSDYDGDSSKLRLYLVD